MLDGMIVWLTLSVITGCKADQALGSGIAHQDPSTPSVQTRQCRNGAYQISSGCIFFEGSLRVL